MFIAIRDENLELLSERALYWSRHRALFVADTHFGKAATFRAMRIPIPGGHTQDELARLTQAIEKTSAEHVYILGDLIHHRRGRDEETLRLVAEWRALHSTLAMTLVRGNHDKGAGDPPPEWNIKCVDAPYPFPPFTLQHVPEPTTDGTYALAGHMHPAVRLQGAGQTLKLPCFWFSRDVGVLPAFGDFSDGGIITPQSGDQVYVIADDHVIQVR